MTKNNIITDISIHTLCEEGDRLRSVSSSSARRISIHTLCEEGDASVAQLNKDCIISIHTLCEEGDENEIIKLEVI